MNSEEELNDLANLYEKYKGDMDTIMESMMFANALEEDRYRDLIQKMIISNRVKSYKAFTNENVSKKRRRAQQAQKEAKEVSKEAKKRKSDSKKSTDNLMLALLANNQRRLQESDSFLDKLSEKYSKSNSSNRKTKK